MLRHLAGTWLGAIFTGLGLLAVLTQLRGLLLYVTAENRRWKERAAGAWASCILIDQMPGNGVQESVVPIFSGWLQHFHLQDKSITTSQDDRGVSDKSSWTNLFARMDIKAADLNGYGGLRTQRAPIRKHDFPGSLWIRPLRPGLGDVLVQNGSISYGFSAAEFAALIILCGFRPKDFAPQSSGHSICYYGQMLVADHGSFSQIARFDSHHGFRDAIKSFKTDLRDVPVAHSFNLAFGMIPCKGRHGREWVIPRQQSNLPGDLFQTSSATIWSGYALPQQLKKIQYSFERFVGVGELHIGDYSQRNEAFETDDVVVLNDLMAKSGLASLASWSHGDSKFATQARELLNATHAIAAIHPWALMPILPVYLTAAVRSILDPFYKTREFTVQVLQRELMKTPSKSFRPQGKPGEELSRVLNAIAGDEDQFFSDEQHSIQASHYHEAMSMFFQHNDIKQEDVRISLAAAVGSKVFWRQKEAEADESFEINLGQYLERCYLKTERTQKSRNVPASGPLTYM
ncbi:hypothetical protein BDR22DRAFT_921390 [Usnea florida]